MAEKILKGINFPGLEDTYIIPEVDSTLSKSGQAADAKVVGEALAGKQPIGNYIKTINGNAPDENGDIVIEISSDEMEQVQSDWDVNDEADAAYIKNKPFGDTADGVEYLNNKYLNFMNRIENYVIAPKEFKFELFTENNGDQYWRVISGDNDSLITQQEWKKLVQTYDNGNGIGIAVVANDEHYFSPITPLALNDDGTPKGFYLGDASLKDVPFFVMIGENEIEEDNFIYPGTIWYHTDLITDNKEILFPEQEVLFQYLDETYGGYTGVFLPPPCKLEVGKKYTVVWDGAEYPVTGIDVSALKPNGVAMGDGRAFGYSGNGEPFIVLYAPDIITGNSMTPEHLAFLSLVDAQPASHTITIYEDEAAYGEFAAYTGTSHTWKIKKEYLPSDLGSSVSWNDLEDKPFDSIEGKEILPLTTYEDFSLYPEFGCYAQDVQVDFTLTVGESYIVNWDGAEYTCVAQDTSAVLPDTVAMGNFSNFGFPDTGEPFIIGSNVNQYGTWGIFIPLTDTDDTGSHSVSISKPPIVKTLDEKYLPDIMEIDAFILRSSTEGSSKRFKITIDDTGTLSVEELGG